MTSQVESAPSASRAKGGRSKRSGSLSAGPARWGAGLLLIFVVCGVAAPLIAPHDPYAGQQGRLLAGPSATHPFGSDDLGRDVLSRVIYSYRISLLVAVGSIGISLPAGILFGTLSGYFGRLVDVVVMRPIEMLLAFPALLLALTLVSVFGSGPLVTIMAIAAIYTPVFARVVRSSTQVVRGELYVQAARCRGASHGRIIVRHVIPNAIGPALVQAAVLAGVAIQIEAALSFLGLGVAPPTPSLGNLLAEGQNFLTQAPWTGIFPGAALALMVLAFNLLGDGLRNRLDPRGVSR